MGGFALPPIVASSMPRVSGGQGDRGDPKQRREQVLAIGDHADGLRVNPEETEGGHGHVPHHVGGLETGEQSVEGEAYAQMEDEREEMVHAGVKPEPVVRQRVKGDEQGSKGIGDGQLRTAPFQQHREMARIPEKSVAHERPAVIEHEPGAQDREIGHADEDEDAELHRSGRQTEAGRDRRCLSRHPQRRR